MFNVIIPCFNQQTLTAKCLSSIQRNIPRDRSDVRVIVVDDCSTDETPDTIAKWADLAARNFALRSIRNDANMGFARSCNRALMEIVKDDPSGIVLFLNNDTELLNDQLFDEVERLLVSRTEDGKEVGIVGGLLFYPSSRNGRVPGRTQHAGIVFVELSKAVHLYRGMSPKHAPGINRFKPMQAVTGACLGMNARDALQLRGFDEDFLNGYEDLDLCFRLRKELGKAVVFSPEVKLLHHEGMTGPKRFLREKENKELFLKKHRDEIVIDHDHTIQQDGGINVSV